MQVVTTSKVITDYHVLELAAAEMTKTPHPVETLGNQMGGQMSIVSGKIAFEFDTLVGAQAFEVAVNQLPQKPQV